LEMSLISFTFLAFYILLFVLYFTCMKNKQWLLLLVGSLVFYAYASLAYLIFLLFSAITTFLAARYIDSVSDQKEKSKKSGRVLCVTLIINLLILCVLKYTNFVIDNINSFRSIYSSGGDATLIGHVSWLLPLGISYYTFIVIGYLVDVSRGISKSESNYLKFLCFVSYFPHITQGPINRYEDLSSKLFAKHDIDVVRIRKGLYRILIGLSKKLIIAERLSVYVDRVYGSVSSYDGLTILVAGILYAIQIYCDFSGYMDMVLGLSGMLGIDMAENFNLPYFATSIADFWRRWHITLGAWFKDYLYYPVLRSTLARKITKALKKSKIKYSKTFIRMVPTVIALLITWCATGIWHGASWHYGLWGLYHGVLIILGTIFAESFKKLNKKLHIKEESTCLMVFRIIRTFILVDIGYVLFRAANTSDIATVFGKIIKDLHINASSIANALLPFTEDNTAISYGGIVFVAVAVLFVSDLCKFVKECSGARETSESVSAPETSESASAPAYKYIFAAIMIVSILLFGIFGQSSFIYMMY